MITDRAIGCAYILIGRSILRKRGGPFLQLEMKYFHTFH